MRRRLINNNNNYSILLLLSISYCHLVSQLGVAEATSSASTRAFQRYAKRDCDLQLNALTSPLSRCTKEHLSSEEDARRKRRR